MELEKDGESSSLADLALPKDDMQGLKQEIPKHSNRWMRIFIKG